MPSLLYLPPMRNLIVSLMCATYYILPVLACSTNSFDASFDAYPDCVARCLACPDRDYTNNFVNNCDYESGECCTDAYKTAIAEVWSCVLKGCEDEVAQEAFQTFVDDCDEKNTPLDDRDVPRGYTTSPKSDEHKLSKGAIIAIAVVAVSAVMCGLIGICIWRTGRCFCNCLRGKRGADRESQGQGARQLTQGRDAHQLTQGYDARNQNQGQEPRRKKQGKQGGKKKAGRR